MKTRLGSGDLVAAVLHGTDRHFAALDLVSAQGTAVAATLTALAAVQGDSLAIRNAPIDSKAQILQIWADVQTAGTLQIRSPKLHDNVRGIRYGTTVADTRPFLPRGCGQRVYPNDVLTVELAAGAVAGDIESVCQLIYYPTLPGADARFIGTEELYRRAVNIFTVENSLSTGTAGGYSGGEAINVENDQFHANGLYALVGYTVTLEAAAIGWRGVDTGNLRVGGPGLNTERELTAKWFAWLSDAFKLPLIPVFSAENKGGILIDALQDENGADPVVTSIFVELSK
jgi:hypothetical protein